LIARLKRADIIEPLNVTVAVIDRSAVSRAVKPLSALVLNCMRVQPTAINGELGGTR
jgi:hypothetical protein